MCGLVGLRFSKHLNHFWQIELPLRSAIRSLCAFVLASAASSALALDLSVVVNPADPELSEGLVGASLLANLPEEADQTGQEILAAAQADYGRLISVLYDAGYIGPQVSILLDGREAASIPSVRAPAQVRSARILVQPGQTFQFGNTTVAPRAAGTVLPGEFATGALARTGVIRDAANAARDAWRDLGHAKAEVTAQKITARHNTRVLDVALGLDPGPKLRFGDLAVSGETSVRPDRIRAIAGLPVGETFSPAALRLSQNRLQRTGTFQSAALIEADEPNGDQLPISAQVTDRLPRSFGFGAEISTEDGLTLSGHWQHRNLLGGAERLRFDAEVSGIGGSDGIDVGLELRFDKPAVRGPDVDYYAFGKIDRLDERHFAANRLVLETGLINKKPRAYTYSYGVGLVYAEATDAFGDRDYLLFTLPATATYDKRDDPLDSRSGSYAELSITPFLAIDGADDGLRTTLDIRHFRPVGDRVTLAFRGQVGSLVGPALSEVPVDFAFYSGGGGTVRGFPYQSMGVTTGGGDIVGGRSFLNLSSELRVKTGDRLSVVGFVDAGYIGSETFPDGSSGDWHTGAGFGVRYDTGVGPIRVDVAKPLSGPSDTSGFEVYIGIGQAF